jgi:hypothetical protein
VYNAFLPVELQRQTDENLSPARRSSLIAPRIVLAGRKRIVGGYDHIHTDEGGAKGDELENVVFDWVDPHDQREEASISGTHDS